MTSHIHVLVLDVDGVITDGTVTLLPSGEEARTVNFRDLDAVSAVRRRGVRVAILSGEDSPSSHRVADRFGITEAVWGAKDKGPAMLELLRGLGVEAADTCFVGDSDRDAPALMMVGIGMAPSDGTDQARNAADHVLDVIGGRGVVAQAVNVLERIGALPTGKEQP